MNLLKALVIAGFLAAVVLGDCCSNYKVSDDCCNVVGCNCDGPCWNAGCKTVCTPDQVACNGNDSYYDCCPSGSKCKDSSKCSGHAWQCCCTGGNKQIVRVTDVNYDTNSASYSGDGTAAKVNFSYKASNDGSTPNPVGSISGSISNTQTTTIDISASITLSVDCTINTGIPKVEDGSISYTASTTFSISSSQSNSVTFGINFDTGSDTIAAYTNQEYQFTAAMQMVLIPFTATAQVIDDCGDTSQQTVRGTAHVSGVASFMVGEFTKLIGPAVPIECAAPWSVPFDKQQGYPFCSPITTDCSTNPVCKRLGLSGTCCDPKNPKSCCSIAKAHPSCTGYNATDLICPGLSGAFADCCTASQRLISAQVYDVEVPDFDVNGTLACACQQKKCTASCKAPGRKCSGNQDCKRDDSSDGSSGDGSGSAAN